MYELITVEIFPLPDIAINGYYDRHAHIVLRKM